MSDAWRLLDRLRGWLRRGHRDVTPDGMPRMLLLTDDPWPTYIGTRSWCDGRARPCRVCGGRCCACRHTEQRLDRCPDCQERK